MSTILSIPAVCDTESFPPFRSLPDLNYKKNWGKPGNEARLRLVGTDSTERIAGMVHGTRLCGVRSSSPNYCALFRVACYVHSSKRPDEQRYTTERKGEYGAPVRTVASYKAK